MLSLYHVSYAGLILCILYCTLVRPRHGKVDRSRAWAPVSGQKLSGLKPHPVIPIILGQGYVLTGTHWGLKTFNNGWVSSWISHLECTGTLIRIGLLFLHLRIKVSFWHVVLKGLTCSGIWPPFNDLHIHLVNVHNSWTSNLEMADSLWSWLQLWYLAGSF